MRQGPDITPADRLSVTLVLSIVVHAMIILGVGFKFADVNEPDNAQSLDVILVKRSSEQPPEDADYLAQANQSGGGTVEDQVRPTSPFTSDIPKTERGIAPQPQTASAPNPQPIETRDRLTQQQADESITKLEPSKNIPERQLPTAAELRERALSVARMEAEIDEQLQAYAKRPKRKFVSANTREYIYASYMQAWVGKVERIGNLNYPAEARRRQIHGQLVMTVGINRDGSIESIDIVEASGQKVLDEAAIRVVELGAPYAPLPENEKERVDILHITRTWQFRPGDVLRHQ